MQSEKLKIGEITQHKDYAVRWTKRLSQTDMFIRQISILQLLYFQLLTKRSDFVTNNENEPRTVKL